MEKENPIKIHIERDYSFVELDVLADISTGNGLPTGDQLRMLFDMLPGKDTQPISSNGLRETSESSKRNAAKGVTRREPLATANQRRVLEKYGEWEEGMTKAEASRILSELGI